MSTADADDFAATMNAMAEADRAAGARTLDGYQMGTLREAVAASTRALARINTKGLTIVHRREVEAAQEALRRAAPIVSKHQTSTG